MGAIEEGGKVASGVVESLKAQPLALALLVVNVMFLAFMGWLFSQVATANRARDAQREVLISELQKTCEALRKPN